jgi:hypothetical protein
VNGVPTDLSLRYAFDAIRSTLNYDPLIVDVIYSKVSEGLSATLSDDFDLYGLNAAYALDKKTSAEAYFFSKVNGAEASTGNPAPGNTNNKGKTDKVYTMGLLLKVNPIEALKASVEAALQLGTRNVPVGADAGNEMSDHQTERRAWAAQAKASYDWKVKYSPNFELSYTLLSGDKDQKELTGLGPQYNGRSFRAWDPMFYGQALNNITFAILPFSNLQVLNFKASMKVLEDVTLSGNYGYYRLNKFAYVLAAPNANMNNNAPYGVYALKHEKDLGNALDLTATYDYTEDVQFSLTSGWFFPGRAFEDDNGKATQVIGSMKVTF